MNYLSEVSVHKEVRVESRLLDFNEKRFHFYQEMYKTESDTLAASHESLGTIVNMKERKSTVMPENIRERFTEVKVAHDKLPGTWQIGHVMDVNSGKAP